MIRSALSLFLIAILAAGAYRNIWNFKRSAERLPPRERDELVVLHNQFKGVREKLAEMGYRSGRIALITRRNLASQPPTGVDGKRLFETQYNLAPLVVLPSTTDAPLTVGCFIDEETPSKIPGFIKIYDAGNGLMLLQRESSQ
jgi:hypothetical protein